MDMRQKLKSLEECNIKISSVAVKAKVSCQALYMYMNGTNKELTQTTHDKLNKALQQVSEELQNTLIRIKE